MKDKFICCFCSSVFTGMGNNPEPLKKESLKTRCCDECNETLVIPARLYNVSKGRDSHKVMTLKQIKEMQEYIRDNKRD